MWFNTQRLRRYLEPSLQGIAIAYLPVFALALAGKLYRAQRDADGLFELLSYLSVDLFLFAFIFLSLWWLADKVRARRSIALATVYWLLFYLCLLYLFWAELLTTEFFRQTGLLLDWQLVLYSIGRFDMMLVVVQEHLGKLLGVVLVAVVLLLAVIPYVGKKHKPAPALAVWAVVLLTGLALLGWGNVYQFPQGAYRGGSLHLFLGMLADSANQQVTTRAKQQVPKLTPVKKGDKPKNVALIVLESTRDRSVDPYVNLGVTPYFAKLAAESVWMENTYTSMPYTSKALYAITCGLFARQGKEIYEAQAGYVDKGCLPHVLQTQGYTSVYFQAATQNFERRKHLVGNMGFNAFYPLEKHKSEGYRVANMFGYEDNVILPENKRWLAAQKKPFIATYLTVAPHFHYNPIKRYGWKEYHSRADYNAYLNALNYQDHFLKNLIDQYKQLGLYKDTVFVVIGDHGQGFREHGLWGHGNFVYDEVMRVPFLVHWAGKLKGQITQRSSVLDVVPTVLDILGFSVHENTYPGLSVFDLPKQNRDIFLSCALTKFCEWVIDGSNHLKYIDNFSRTPNRLYDLKADPLEKKNLIKHAEYQKQLRAIQDKLRRLHSRFLDGRPTPATQATPVLGETVETSTQRYIRVAPEKKALQHAQTYMQALKEPYSDTFAKVALPGVATQTFVQKVQKLPTQRKDGGRWQGTKFVEAWKIGEKQLFLYRFALQFSNGKQSELRLTIRGDKVAGVYFFNRWRDRFGDTLGLRVLGQSSKGKIVTDKFDNAFYRSDKKPVDKALALAYIQAIRQGKPIDVPAKEALKTPKVVQAAAQAIARYTQTHGAITDITFEESWNVNQIPENHVYRFKASFAKGRAMEFRVFVYQGRVDGFYFFFPWRQTFKP